MCACVQEALSVLEPDAGQEHLSDLSSVSREASLVELRETDLPDCRRGLLLTNRTPRMAPAKSLAADSDRAGRHDDDLSPGVHEPRDRGGDLAELARAHDTAAGQRAAPDLDDDSLGPRLDATIARVAHSRSSSLCSADSASAAIAVSTASSMVSIRRVEPSPVAPESRDRRDALFGERSFQGFERLAIGHEVDLVEGDDLASLKECRPIPAELASDRRVVGQEITALENHGPHIEQMNDYARALEVTQELVAEAGPFAGPLDEAGNIGHHEAGVTVLDDAQ